ncbi:MAG TPA: sterol desaturase family protein [Polyangiales bacterium]
MLGVLGIPLGLAYANAAEWVIHRYVLHGLGKKKSSFWNFHWGEHHRASRKQGFFDPDYQRSPIGNHAQGKELLAVAGLLVVHAPLFAVAPWFTASVWYSGLNYLRVHRKAHLDPAWAKQHLKHHYDHHMGLDQDQNWGVTHAWFDRLLGTRVEYEYDENGRVKKPGAAAPTPVLPTQAAPVTEAAVGAELASNDQRKSKTAA